MRTDPFKMLQHDTLGITNMLLTPQEAYLLICSKWDECCISHAMCNFMHKSIYSDVKLLRENKWEERKLN